MECDPTRVCELLVGLPDVTVLGVVDVAGYPLEVHVETRGPRPSCLGCGTTGWVKDRDQIELVDLPAFGRPTRLWWRKHRWKCPNRSCAMKSWTGEDARIAAPRQALTDRAGRWVTRQVGGCGRTVNEIAVELGCDWHTINDALIAYGTALVDDDTERIGEVTALGLDETMFNHVGPWRKQCWSTSIVDVARGVLLDVVPGRDSAGPCKWLGQRTPEWRALIRWATLDLSGPYRAVFDTMLPDATQVADPFHVVKLANSKLDEVRRRVQNDTLGHRGRTDDPLYRCRKLLVMADERLDANGKTKLLGLLEAGDPKGEVRTAWHAKEMVRQIYSHTNAAVAVEYVERLGHDLQDESCPPEINQLGRTLRTWRHQIAAWHQAHVSNGPTEAVNNLIKRVKRVAFGMMSFTNYRIRVLLYAGKPNWDLLPTITPR